MDLIHDFRGSSIGICFDSSHANLWKSPKVEDYLKSVSAHVISTHFPIITVSTTTINRRATVK